MKPLPPDANDFGQIRPGSPFGDCLTRIAMESEVIVETGTWMGLGSTYCIALGLIRPTQHFWTVEMCKPQYDHARAFYLDEPRITLIHGTLVLPEEVPPFTYPDPEFKKYYDIETEINKTTPYVLDQIPLQIDLLLIDGGAWSGPVEFQKLWQRANYIAMDDTNPERESKNDANRRFLLKRPDWKCIEDHLKDRNGWAVFKRL